LGEDDTGESRKELGHYPDTKQTVLLLRGPYGYYVQLGEAEEGSKIKPKRVTWPKELPVEQADLGSALKLLSLPRELGLHPASGKKVIVNIGRFGPYIGHDGKFKSIPRSDNIFDIGLDRAIDLLAQAKTGGNTVLRTLGEHPADQSPVEVCSGRYGPYVRHGKVNATLPKNLLPESVTLEEALELIGAKAVKAVPEKAKASKKPASKVKSLKVKVASKTKKAEPKTVSKSVKGVEKKAAK